MTAEREPAHGPRPTRPGERLRAVAARVCATQTMERLIDPLIADLQHEYTDARRRHGVWGSRWTLFMGYVVIVKAIALHCAEQSMRALHTWAVADDAARRKTLACAVAVTAVFTVLGQMAVLQQGRPIVGSGVA